jgi:hypothetical protein
LKPSFNICPLNFSTCFSPLCLLTHVPPCLLAHLTFRRRLTSLCFDSSPPRLFP